MIDVRIQDVYPHQAWYKPGEQARLHVDLHSTRSEEFQGTLRGRLLFLTEEVEREEVPLHLSGAGTHRVDIQLPLPSEQPRGYGVEVTLVDKQGRSVGQRWTALDVLTHWTEAPRYGFVSDFSPDRSDIEETMEWLVRYHINALQFYDWMYRHDTLLPPEDRYRDPLGRLLSRRTIEAMVKAAARRHIASMAYVAVYAASVPFWRQHREWGLYNGQGTPIPFGDDFLYIMNPEPDSRWTHHLLQEMANAVRAISFEGVHLDQYGEPREGFDNEGYYVDVARAFAGFIKMTKYYLHERGVPSTVVFNAVNNWPIDALASTPQDFMYIELWPPHTHFKDLWSLTVAAQRKSGGKPVVLAAYMSPSHSYNVRLMNAIIFASGGAHIELGEKGRMLADPYFPKHEPISSRLSTVLRRYYDFAVQYENVLRLDTEDITDEIRGRVKLEGIGLTHEGENNRVWVIGRRGMGMDILQFINLAGLKTPQWTEPVFLPPPPLHNLQVRYYTQHTVRRVWLASPDTKIPAAREISFTRGTNSRGPFVEFVVPSLKWWTLIGLTHSI